MPKFVKVSRYLGAVVGIAIFFAPSSIQAQSLLGDPRSIPSGSPLAADTQGAQQQYVDPRLSSEAVNGVSTGRSNSIEGTRAIAPTQVVDTDGNLVSDNRLDSLQQQNGLLNSSRLTKPPKPSEFEDYVARVLGRRLTRFGSNLLLPSERDFATPATASTPSDYMLNVGDTVSISMTGSIEGSVDRQIDTDGKIFLPKIGSIQLAGVRYSNLKDRVSAAIGRQYRGYTVTVGIKRLRGIRVYVTGFANNPGAFTVSSLSTIANAVFSAGGPNSGGSFRSVKLYRRGQEVADFDMYQLVRGGNRLNDAVLQNEDVLFIPPAGPQIAVFGSVNEEAIYEARSDEAIETLIAYAGGPNSLGDPSRVILYRSNADDRVGAIQVTRNEAATASVVGGDLLQVLSRGSLVRPVERQAVLVRIEGEVNKPGNYYVGPNTPLATVLQMAGGLTARAFPYGSRLTRESVRTQQRASYREAIDQLEMTLVGAPLAGDRSADPGERSAQLAAARALIDKMRATEPDGRLVLSIPYGATQLPGDLLMENNDGIFVPPLVNTVGVFGAVYRPASFILSSGRPLRARDYIERAGGNLRTADNGNVFIVRASGEVLTRKRGALSAFAQPGDVIFVPVKTQSSSLLAKIRDITQIVFQLGFTAAAIGTIR